MKALTHPKCNHFSFYYIFLIILKGTGRRIIKSLKAFVALQICPK